MAYQKAERDWTLAIDQETLAKNVIVNCPLSDKQEDFINCKSNFVFYGGGQNGAKSHYCMLSLLVGAVDDPDYTALVLRNSLTKIKQVGGLWSMSKRLFPKYGASSNGIEHTFKFPSGANIKYGYLTEGAAEELHQGANATNIVIDEICEEGIDEDSVMYLIGRLRGASKQGRQLRSTGNPSRNSFLRIWLERAGFIDKETGYTIPERDGKEVRFVQVSGEVKFFDTKQEIEDVYGKDIANMSMTFSYFSSTILDNPYALKYDPFAVTSLNNLKPKQRDRLLYGCWLDTDTKGYLERSMFPIINRSDIPLDEHLIEARAWDFAASKVGENGELHPDYTVGIKGLYSKQTGQLIVTSMVRFQESFAVVEEILLKTAQKDQCLQIIPQDAGAAAKQICAQRKAKIIRTGCKVAVAKTSKSKLDRATPMILAAQRGEISVCKDVFDDNHWSELEAFDGSRSTRHRKDDIPDSLGDLYSVLSQGLLVPTIKIGNKKETKKRLSRLGGKTLL